MTQTPQVETSDKPKPSKKFIIIVVLLLLVVGGIAYWWMHRGEISTDNATLESHVVAIAPRVAGYVAHVGVEDNQKVKSGGLLVQLDQRDYVIARDKAQADLGVAQADLALAQKRLARLETLEAKARSQQAFDEASAQASSAQARVAAALADLEGAQKNLSDTVITTLIDGTVSHRSVEKGAYVQPGQQLLSVVGNNVWVVANFKETQLDKMKPGQRVTIEVDAHPGLELTGKIDSIQSGTGARFSLFPPENATGNFIKIVQRVPVKIILDKQPDALQHLAPGMSVVPTVHTIP